MQLTQHINHFHYVLGALQKLMVKKFPAYIYLLAIFLSLWMNVCMVIVGVEMIYLTADTPDKFFHTNKIKAN